MATETHVPFTSNRVEAMKWDGRRSDIRYDSSPKAPGSGFGVRCYSSGRKSWVLQFRAKERVGGFVKAVRGKVHLRVLGNVRTMSLHKAREVGLQILQELEVGIDPNEDRSLEGITLSDFLPIYLDIKKREGTTKARSLYEIERRVKNYLTEGFYRINKELPKVKSPVSGKPVYQREFFKADTKKFGDKPLTDIKRKDFEDLFYGIKSGEKSATGQPSPVEGNRLKVHLNNIYVVAEMQNAVPEGFSYPTRLIKSTPEEGVERWLEDRELKRLYQVLEEEPHGKALYAVQLLVHTGMRKEELLSLQWGDVHLDRVSGRACVPPHIFVGTTKTKTKLFSVLAPQAIQIFEHLASQRTSHPAVFPSDTIEGKSIQDVRHQWNRIRRNAGLKNFRMHDLRHSVGTWLGALGFTELQIARTLNHKKNTVTERYSLIPNEKKEEVICALADWLQDQVGPPILKELVQGT